MQMIRSRLMQSPSAPLTGPPTITGKVVARAAGTMKQKRQIQEHTDQGYSDDIFDSTPFRKKMKHVEVRCGELQDALVRSLSCSFRAHSFKI